MKLCRECDYWEKDKYPYGDIYFGICRREMKQQSEYHECHLRRI